MNKYVNYYYYYFICTWLYLALPDCAQLYQAVPWSSMIYLSTECHIVPLTGLHAFVSTGLNAQKLCGQADGQADSGETRFVAVLTKLRT